MLSYIVYGVYLSDNNAKYCLMNTLIMQYCCLVQGPNPLSCKKKKKQGNTDTASEKVHLKCTLPANNPLGSTIIISMLLFFFYLNMVIDLVLFGVWK